MRRRSSRVLVFGLAIFALGLGNFAFGGSKVALYKARQLEAVRLGGFEVSRPFRGTESILDDRTEMHEYYEDSLTRYRYYKLLRRGGRFLMGVGGAIVLGALVRRLAVRTPARGWDARTHTAGQIQPRQVSLKYRAETAPRY
jgi:hypothetical protein